MMKLRPYDHERDFECIAAWVTDARSHALWCANLIPYPPQAGEVKMLLEKDAHVWGGRAYVAVDDRMQQIGFFVCSANEENRTAFLKFVLIDPQRRGRGAGTQMVRLAMETAFEQLHMEHVQLNVFGVNTAAIRCYQKAGFVAVSIQQAAFSFENEQWDRWNMRTE